MALQLNEAQLKAVYSKEPKVLVVAPAGSGKTACMCAAIQEYMLLHPTHSVTAITFTKKAATELGERIHNNKVKTGTIHAWALQQLYGLGSKYGFNVELLEEEEMRRIMQQIAYRKNLKYVNIYQLYNYIVGNIKTLDLDDVIAKKYEKIKALYIQYKKERQLYDFTDLPQYLLDVLNEYDEEIYTIDGLFVDEFQDIDATQYEIFKKVNASKKFLIGDFRQAIYGFNNALEDVFERLAADGYKTYNLDTNYRSKQSIMDVADSFRDFCENEAFITSLKELKHSDILCSRGSGGHIYFIDANKVCTTLDDSTIPPDDIIRRLLRESDTMILCRSNKQVRKLQAIGLDNCSTVHQAKGLEYDNVILCDMQINNQEELNIAYVGMTRARNELCVINFEVLVSILSKINIKEQQQIQKAKNMLF